MICIFTFNVQTYLEDNSKISNLGYRDVIVEHLLNSPIEKDVVIKLPTIKQFIEFILNDEKEAFQAVVTIQNYFIQHEQNIP